MANFAGGYADGGQGEIALPGPAGPPLPTPGAAPTIPPAPGLEAAVPAVRPGLVRVG